MFPVASPSAVTGRLLIPSNVTTAAGGGLEGSSAGELSRALLPEVRRRKFRIAARLEGLTGGGFNEGCCCCSCCWACSSALAMLSTVSVLDRSTAVSMVGALGLRRNFGILSMAGKVGEGGRTEKLE